jgi:ABC-type phosphate/phosphonate transport system ATPase subunit
MKCLSAKKKVNGVEQTGEHPCLEIRQLVAGYRHFQLKNIEVAISKGSFTGIIGPNGSGKTTLLKTILGDIPFGREKSGYTANVWIKCRYDSARAAWQWSVSSGMKQISLCWIM